MINTTGSIVTLPESSGLEKFYRMYISSHQVVSHSFRTNPCDSFPEDAYRFITDIFIEE